MTMVTPKQQRSFIEGCLEAARIDLEDDDIGIAPETREALERDCLRFLESPTTGDDIESILVAVRNEERDPWPEYRHAGYLFWHTRNRAGVGFWEGDYPDDVGTRLTRWAHSFPEVSLLEGDDGAAHLFG